MNSQRKYPLADWASGVDATGNFTIPDDLLLGLYFPLHVSTDINPTLIFLSRVVSYPTGIVLSLSYAQPSVAKGNYPIIAMASIDTTGHIAGNSYPVIGLFTDGGDTPTTRLGGFQDCVGRVMLGPLASLQSQPAGLWNFDFEGGALDPDVIRPMIRGVTSFAVINGNESTDRIVGGVDLIDGINMRITTSIITGPDGGPYTKIRFDAISGAGLSAACECVGVAASAPPIRTINGVAPDPDGAFTLTTDACVSASAISHGLKLTNTCSTPCCGSKELTALLDEITYMKDQATTLHNYVNQLKSQVDANGAVILASRLNNTDCLTCP